jgi:hypothetical protein
MGERLVRELQLEASGRVPRRRNLLVDEGDPGAGGAMARHYNTVRPHSSLGYRPTAPKARLPTRQLSELRDSGATLMTRTGTRVRVGTMRWSELIGGDVVISPPRKWQLRFNASDVACKESYRKPGRTADYR